MIGQVINNYRIQSVVTEGGMGKVYLAEHPVIGRRAAIKVLRPRYLEDKAMVTRFVNEARAANAIRHPNIVEIIDVGTLPDGTPYLMMEFLDGESLATRMARLGRLPPVSAAGIADQAAAALQATHAAGIIHRDLKPDNLFLVPDRAAPRGERVKLLDFGIAKLTEANFGPSARTTGNVLGTPSYMAPEQCRGGAIDHRLDVYALGAILYHMLCGRPPFVAASAMDVMMMHVAQLPAAPRVLFPDLPEALERVVLRALAKKPEDWFASMADLREALGPRPSVAPPPLVVSVKDLRRLPEGTPISSASLRRQFRRIIWRRRAPWVALAVVLGIGAGWLGASRLFSGRPPAAGNQPAGDVCSAYCRCMAETCRSTLDPASCPAACGRLKAEQVACRTHHCLLASRGDPQLHCQHAIGHLQMCQ